MQQIDDSTQSDDSTSDKLIKLKPSHNLFECCAKVSLASLPHFVIIFIFIVYLLIGTAILNEIQISDEQTLIKPTHFVANVIDQKESHQYQKYESYILFNKYKLKLNDIYLDVLFNLRKHQTDISSNYKKFLTRLDKILVDEIFNRTESTDIGISNPMKSFVFNPDDDEEKKEKKYKSSKNFISQVYKIHNEHSIDLLQTIANHLIETKNDLKLNISKNIKSLISGYKRKHSDSEKKLMDFIQNNENLVKQQDFQKTEMKLDIKTEETNQEEAENIQSNSTFLRTLYFMATLITSTGHSKSSPETWIGKIFIITYLVIGLPLAVLFLAAWRSIITVYLNFMHKFNSLLFFTDNYLNRLLKFVKIPFIASIFNLFTVFKSKKVLKPSKRSLADIKKTESTLIAEQDYEHETFIQFLIDVTVTCVKQTSNNFNFSITTSLVFIFIYLTIGASAAANYFGQPLIDSYYFLFVLLAKIDVNFIESNIDLFRLDYVVLMVLYSMVGISLISLTIQTINIQIKLILIRNMRNVILKLILFFNQFGYELKIDNFNFDFDTVSQPLLIDKNISISTSSSDQDDDESSQSRRMSFTNHYRSKRTINKKQDSVKSDKQTQITTLLCSKLIKVKELSASHTSFVDTSGSASESVDSKSSSLIFEPKRRLWSDENLNRRYSSLDPITDNISNDEAAANHLADSSTDPIDEDKSYQINDVINDEIKSIINDIEMVKPNEEINSEFKTTIPTIRVNSFVTNRPLGTNYTPQTRPVYQKKTTD